MMRCALFTERTLRVRGWHLEHGQLPYHLIESACGGDSGKQGRWLEQADQILDDDWRFNFELIDHLKTRGVA